MSIHLPTFDTLYQAYLDAGRHFPNALVGLIHEQNSEIFEVFGDQTDLVKFTLGMLLVLTHVGPSAMQVEEIRDLSEESLRANLQSRIGRVAQATVHDDQQTYWFDNPVAVQKFLDILQVLVRWCPRLTRFALVE